MKFGSAGSLSKSTIYCVHERYQDNKFLLYTWINLKPKKFSIVFVCWNKIR